MCLQYLFLGCNFLIRRTISTFRYVIANTSVEPSMFFYMITWGFSGCLSTSLLVYKACDPIGSAGGQQIGKKCPDEVAAQHVVAPINGWKMLVQNFVPIALAMVAGTWSDRRRRRRPLMVMSIAGQIATDVVSLICVVWWSVSPVATAVAQTIVLSLSGSSPMMFVGINSFVADSTSEESLTAKYGLVNGIATAGFIVGLLVFGTVSAYSSFMVAYMVCIGIGAFTMALTFVFVKEGADAPASDDGPANASPSSGIDEPSSCWNVVSFVNPITVLRKSFRVLTKKRPGHDTAILLLTVFACAPLTSVPIDGEFSIMYLFLRKKFGWNEVQFAVFNIYTMAIIFIGVTFTLSILSHKYRLDDALIGSIASVFDLLASIAFLLVSQSWQLYLVPPLELFRGAALALTSSIASKCVESDELGSMYSIKILTEGTMKSAITPLYNFVYDKTLETMPSAFFLISIALTVPLVVNFSTIYYLHRKKKLNDLDM